MEKTSVGSMGKVGGGHAYCFISHSRKLARPRGAIVLYLWNYFARKKTGSSMFCVPRSLKHSEMMEIDSICLLWFRLLIWSRYSWNFFEHLDWSWNSADETALHSSQPSRPRDVPQYWLRWTCDFCRLLGTIAKLAKPCGHLAKLSIRTS